MQVIPVIDLLGGQVVRGVGGRRSEYRPIASPLCPDARPVTAALAFQRLGLRLAYVADLDAIAGGPPAWTVYRELRASGQTLWIDAGVRELARARELAEFHADSNETETRIDGVLAGLETVPDPSLLAELQTLLGPRLIFSLDLRDGRPLCGDGWASLSPQGILEAALAAGVERFVILDLARVGEGSGPGTEALCRWLRARAPQAHIVAGGGVRGRADLEQLARWGCSGALVASALHSGALGANDLQGLA